MARTHCLGLALLLAVFSSPGHGALVVNSAIPITDLLRVNVIAVADNDGTDSTAGVFGTAAQQSEVFSFIDTIFAQAGVDVDFTFRSGTYQSSFARTGTPGSNNPRPGGDLNTIRNNATVAGGVLSGDPNTLNVFVVSIVPNFSQLDADSSAGYAFVGGNGVTYYGGSTLPTFTGGREVLASVLAHELGHNLGLDHVSISQDLMNPDNSGERLNAAQIQAIHDSSFTVPIPEPGMVRLLSVAVLIVSSRRRNG